MDILKGVRVIDITAWMFVPGCGGVLAHWGADVIKIEPTRFPDPGRGMTDTQESSNIFKHYNRGKRGIALDLSSDKGREILYRLVKDADVFLTSYLPETRKKLKIDVDDIRVHNPRIIYARGSGRGPKGPHAERGGYDLATWWGRGSLADTAMKASGVELPPGMTGHGDGMAGHTLAGGICAALFKRERTGQTSVVDGSLMGTAIWFNGPAINGAAIGQPWQVAAPRETKNPLSNPYRTSDGRWIQLCMISSPDADWTDLVTQLGRPELGNDPRFATVSAREENKAEAVRTLDEVFGAHTYEEMIEIMAGCSGVWEPIQTAADIHEDVQTKANGFVRKVRYANGEEVSLVVPGVMFDEDAGDVYPAPAWGEHTDEVLGELGITAEEISRYREAGAIK